MSFIATSSTTSFLQCLSRPGPSRLASRLQPCSACARQLRQASSSTTESASTSEAVGDNDADVITARESTAQAAAPVKGQGYDTWLRSVGRQYKDAPSSGPNWLGGHVVCSSPLPLSCIVLISSRSPTQQIRLSVRRRRSLMRSAR